jgi:nucleotide-binding universal stress UspA family protein
VLLCLDRAPSSERALPPAVAPKALGASLKLLHVQEPLRGALGTATLGQDSSWWEALSYLAGRRRAILHAGVQVRILLAERRRGQAIVAAARARSGAILALCSRSGPEGGKGPLGSTARAALWSAPGCVLLVPASVPERDLSAVLRFRRVLLALDGSAPVEPAQRTVLHLASSPGVELELATLSSATGNPGDALGRLVERENPDLTVLPTHGRADNPRWRYGALAQHTMEDCRTPFLLVRTVPPSGGPRGASRINRSAKSGTRGRRLYASGRMDDSDAIL